MGILSYKAVCRTHNHLCRAVILFELEYSGIVVTLRKAENITDIGSTEGIDTLRIIAHHAHRLTFLCKLPHYSCLQLVGILILVDKQITEFIHILLAHLGELLKKVISIEQKVVEIHCIGLTATLAITAIYIMCIRNARTLVVAHKPCIGSILVWGYKTTLCTRYTFANYSRLVYFFVELHLLHNALYQGT